MKNHLTITYPVNPKSDQYQVSPNNISTITYVCNQEKRLWEFIKWSPKKNALNKILSANSVMKCIEISVESLYLDIGTYNKGLISDAFDRVVKRIWDVIIQDAWYVNNFLPTTSSGK